MRRFGNDPADPGSRVALGALSLAVLLGAMNVAVAADWPQYGGPDGNWVSKETGWRSDWNVRPPQSPWRFPVGSGISSMAVVAGRVYAAGFVGEKGQERLVCLDVKTGQTVWQYERPASGNKGSFLPRLSTPLSDGVQVLFLHRGGQLSCLSAHAGQVLWEKQIQSECNVQRPAGGFCSSPILDGPDVLLNVGAVLVLEWVSGRTVRLMSGGGTRQVKPASGAAGDVSAPAFLTWNGVRYAAAHLGTSIGMYELHTGKSVAQLSTLGTSGEPYLTTQGNLLFTTSGPHPGIELLQFRGTGFSSAWKNAKMHFSSYVLWNTYLYGLDSGLVCVDFRDGTEKWRRPDLDGHMIAADGKLIILTRRGDLVLAEASPSAYHEIGRVKAVESSDTPPVLANGRIYCRGREGDLVCLDVTADAPGAPAAGPPTSGAAVGVASPPGPAGKVEGLKNALLAKALLGKLDTGLAQAFETYAEAKARETYVPLVVSENAWDQICKQPVIRQGLLVGAMPDCSPNVPRILQTLQAKFGPAVESHPHLALALALVGAGPEHPGANGECDLARKQGRPLPTVEQSFAYYLQHENEMRTSLRNTPWPILAYVADNDVPLDEREWALKQYGKVSEKDLGKIYYDVDYDTTKLQGKPRLAGPYTLPNLAKFGGVCRDQAYYASRVMKSLGLPAFYSRGEGKGAGHAWVQWVQTGALSCEFMSSGRFDYDNYYTGDTFCPLADRVVLESEVRLTAAAVTASYRAYMDALIACQVYDLAAPEQRPAIAAVLKVASERSPYCPGPWRRLAKACAEAVLTEAEGEKLCNDAVTRLVTVPDLTFEVIEQVMAGRFVSPAGKAPQGVQKNLAVLEQAFQLFEQAKRPDLSAKVRGLHGQYLEALGRHEDAVKVYVAAAQQYADKHYGFIMLVERVIELKKGPEHRNWRIAFLNALLPKVKEYQSSWARLAGNQNVAFVRLLVLIAAERQ
jgi:outer membrane protein assembly factor BamB